MRNRSHSPSRPISHNQHYRTRKLEFYDNWSILYIYSISSLFIDLLSERIIRVTLERYLIIMSVIQSWWPLLTLSDGHQCWVGAALGVLGVYCCQWYTQTHESVISILKREMDEMQSSPSLSPLGTTLIFRIWFMECNILFQHFANPGINELWPEEWNL